MLKKVIKHIILVLKHKWVVFKLCCRVGLVWRRLVHDISKFTPTEFFESAKYYVGTRSPVVEARKSKGYSNAYFHHMGRNMHHFKYWQDMELPEVAIVIPYKYVVEMVCDNLAAGIVYNGKNWRQDTQYNYWQKHRKKVIANPKIDNFLTEVFSQVKDYGISKTLTRKNMKELYKKYCIDDKTEYIYEFKGEWKKVNNQYESKSYNS